MYQVQWISHELYNISLVIRFIVLAVIFERMRRATRESKDDRAAKRSCIGSGRIQEQAGKYGIEKWKIMTCKD